MSSRLTAPFRLATKAPRAIRLLSISAVATTVLVAPHGHPSAAPVPVSAPTSATPDTASPAVTADATTATTTATTTVDRQPAVSRSAKRVERKARKAERKHAARASRRHKAKHRSLAPRNATRTVASAVRATVNAPGQCLQWSREQAGIPSKYSDASTAWRHATGRRSGNANPPRGAAVYWTGGSHGYGHIAISVGHHKVRSSDAGGSGRVATVSIRELSKKWHLKYAGWSNSINGYTIPGVAST